MKERTSEASATKNNNKIIQRTSEASATNKNIEPNRRNIFI